MYAARPECAQLSMPATLPISFILHPHLSPMPPSKCPGCQQVFEDPRGFANHKRQCCEVKGATAQCLKQFQARDDKGNRILTHATQIGDGRLRVEEGQDGLTSIVVDGMPLVHLDLLLILVRSNLNAIRMRSPTFQPPNCIPLADRIERFDFQSTIRMRFHRIHLLCPTRHISYILANLVMRKTSSLETLETILHLHLPPQSHQHTTPVRIPMGSIMYI